MLKIKCFKKSKKKIQLNTYSSPLHTVMQYWMSVFALWKPCYIMVCAMLYEEDPILHNLWKMWSWPDFIFPILASRVLCFFSSDQLFIFGLPNVVLSTGFFYVSHALIQQIMSALPTSLTLTVLLLCWVLLKRLSAPCVNTFLCGQWRCGFRCLPPVNLRW